MNPGVPEHDPPARSVDRRRLRVLIGGASGLIGSRIRAALAADGHSVIPLIRGRTPNVDEIAWDPTAGRLDPAALDGVHAVAHFGGVSIARRFSKRHKHAIRESRVQSTALLARAIAAAANPPRTFLCASAVGYYGNRGDDEMDETNVAGTGFLPEVCTEWEAAAGPARDAGVRVANLRLGVVLSGRGGALATMRRAFSIGLGGVAGNGRQWMSWIALADVVRAIQHVLETESLCGPVNLAAPNPVTNREFTKTLGRLLRRPTLLPVPAPAIRLLLGEMGQALLLDGVRAVPRALLDSGYPFAFPTLEAALRHELGLPPR